MILFEKDALMKKLDAKLAKKALDKYNRWFMPILRSLSMALGFCTVVFIATVRDDISLALILGILTLVGLLIRDHAIQILEEKVKEAKE